MKKLFTFFLLIGALNGYGQGQLIINGGFNLPAGSFQKNVNQAKEYGLAENGSQLGLDYLFNPDNGSFKLSFGYGRNPIDIAGYKTVERQKNPNNAIHWDVATQPYEHLHLLAGPNINILNGPLACHLSGLVGAIYTRFPKVVGMALMTDNKRFEKTRASATNIGFGYNFNLALAHEISEKATLNLTLGYYRVEHQFEDVEIKQTPYNGSSPKRMFTQNYLFNVNFFTLKTGIGFHLN